MKDATRRNCVKSVRAVRLFKRNVWQNWLDAHDVQIRNPNRVIARYRLRIRTCSCNEHFCIRRGGLIRMANFNAETVGHHYAEGHKWALRKSAFQNGRAHRLASFGGVFRNRKELIALNRWPTKKDAIARNPALRCGIFPADEHVVMRKKRQFWKANVDRIAIRQMKAHGDKRLSPDQLFHQLGSHTLAP